MRRRDFITTLGASAAMQVIGARSVPAAALPPKHQIVAYAAFVPLWSRTSAS
jgi:hypothetical protein